jgi:HEAT repeat protein
MLKPKLAPQEIYHRRDELGLNNSIKMLAEVIEDDDRGHRIDSIKYLGLLSDSSLSMKKECFEILENVIVSENNIDIRCAAAKALGRTDYIKSLKPLKWILNQPKIDNKVKISSLKAIANLRFEEKEINLFIKELNTKSKPFKDSLRNHLILLEPEKLIKCLVDSLYEESYRLDHKIEIIKLIGYELASINVSFDDFHYITFNFPEILSYLIKAKTILIDIITANLKEDDQELMGDILNILRVLGDEVNSALLDSLENDDFIVKMNSIILVGKLCIKEGVPILIDSIDDMYNEVSQAAIEALGEIGELSTIPALMKVLNTENVEFEYIDLDAKWFILDSVKKICMKNKDCSLEYLYKTLDKDTDVLKESVAYIMGEIGREEYVQPLIELFNERNLDIKKNAIIAIGKIGSREALESLINILDDEHTYWLIKKVAIDAIYNIYVKNWIKRKDDLTRGTRKLTQNTEKIIDYLNRSEKENFKVRLGIIKFLEKFGGKTALPALLRRVNDFHSTVKISATKAIKRIEERLEFEN